MTLKKGTSYASLTISLAGVTLIAAILFQPRYTPTYPTYNLPIWTLFSTLCLLGASATLFPHLCGHVKSPLEALGPSRITTFQGILIVHGHHPLCGEFQCHEITINGKTFCASCVGLLLGAITAIFLATHHFIYRITYTMSASLIGLGFIILGLLYIPFLKTFSPVLRSLFNWAFVVGFALLLVGIDKIGILEYDMIAVGMFVFWMFTRIQMSRWDHGRVCLACGYRCDARA
jgi:hypothetical protein